LTNINAARVATQLFNRVADAKRSKA